MAMGFLWKSGRRTRRGRESVTRKTTEIYSPQWYDTILRKLIALPNSFVPCIHAVVPFHNSKVRHILHLAVSKVAEDILLDDRELWVVAGGLQVVEEIIGASPQVKTIHVNILGVPKTEQGNSTE